MSIIPENKTAPSNKVSGIVLVDKPAGISSAGLVARIKAIFGAKKAGHAGALDPFATGLVVCCLNQATRLSQFFLKGDKAYTAGMVLGLTTDTQDATGRVCAEAPVDPDISAETVREVAEQFVGPIQQIPPVYSALKHQGTPLYRLARKGIAVEKPARPVTIHHLDIEAVELPVVRFSVSCSAGTYIRTLCADMGQALGCGGHLATLRRTAACGFSVDQAFSLDALEALKKEGQLATAVISMTAALPMVPEVMVGDQLARKVLNGTPLRLSDF
ncbi:tRNA pseudouridine(55) synthase TruB, partial [Desulfosarcina sp. OttesenSCG-928-B08]|nr:tRNA pseudouridine(55) synthase TruB [Desulfosarcina sp. OttesenSCG-928-B08]